MSGTVAVAKVGGEPAPADVRTCAALPVATATGLPEASYEIILPSVPEANFAKVIESSATVEALSAKSTVLAVKLTVPKRISAEPSYIFKSWAVAAPEVSNQIVPATAELGLEEPELLELIADRTPFKFVLKAGNELFSIS